MAKAIDGTMRGLACVGEDKGVLQNSPHEMADMFGVFMCICSRCPSGRMMMQRDCDEGRSHPSDCREHVTTMYTNHLIIRLT